MSTIYLKITDSKGHSHIGQRESWDLEAFFASVIRQYAADKKNPCIGEVVTREDYLRSIKK